MGHSPCSAPALRATTKRSPRHCHIAQQCGRNAGADLHARFIRETDCIFWLTHRCSSGSQLEASHWSFFVFSLEEPLTPHLEQFDVLTASLPENTLTAVQNSLQNRLAARFGPGEDRSPRVGVSRSVPWPQYQRWETADVQIELNLSEFDPHRKEGRLTLQARQRPLLEVLKEDERLRLVGRDPRYNWYGVGTGIESNWLKTCALTSLKPPRSW